MHAFKGHTPCASAHTQANCVPALPEYRLIGKKGEGTFSEVLKAQCIKNGKYVAIKCMKNHFDSLEQAPPCAHLARPGPAPPRPFARQVNNLREIQALRRLSPHPGIIKLCEVLYDQPTVCCCAPPFLASSLCHGHHLPPLTCSSLPRSLLLPNRFFSTSPPPRHHLFATTSPLSYLPGPARPRLRADGHEHLRAHPRAQALPA